MTSSDVLAASDCEQVLVLRDRVAAVTAVVAVHDTRLGPAHGGIRRLPYASLAAALADVVALAEAMTWKCALAEVPAGGGKAVILDRPGLDRAAAYRLVGRAVAQLGGRYFTGPDVGTTDDDLRVVAQETRFVAGGDGEGPTPGELTAATATGVAAALGALAARLELPMQGLHVAVQGLGAIGMQLCAQLHAAGARLTVADVVPARTAAAASSFGAAVVPAEQIVQTPCDVFAPCALGGVLTATVAAALPARGVCGAANNIFAEAEAATVLHRRSVRVVPDFVANAGALIVGATWRLQGVRVGAERLARIADTAGELLDRAEAELVPPSVLALQLAKERLARGPVAGQVGPA
ncbi:MAG TPA: Glu/Leu/Phe/Val dehydrogenase dimerization domain-containing protein [Planctomycetota bacterium]|nr:Glu/Leu/Phe/Val dehydrogenase dimerization domain-containing protein [Planctomycetota bacterium]